MDLGALRPVILYIHVLSAFVFVLCHGVAGFVGFSLRRDPEPARVRHLLELVGAAFPLAYLALLTAVVTGIVAAVIAGQFGQLWPWMSIAVVVATYLAMVILASGPLAAIREAVGIRSYRMKKVDPDPVPKSPAEVAALVAAWRPEAVAGVGVVALMVLLWLMRSRPF